MDQLKAICSASSCNGVHCQAKGRLESTLHDLFKFETFKPGQLEAMLPVLHCKDVFVRMATGAGKSLCMFLPPLAVCRSAMGVIISPLNALMDQQVSIYE